MSVHVDLFRTITAPFPDVKTAQTRYVEATCRHHWLRKTLNMTRAKQWPKTCAKDNEQIERDIELLEWLTAEAEGQMVGWRAVLHAHGVSAI